MTFSTFAFATERQKSSKNLRFALPFLDDNVFTGVLYVVVNSGKGFIKPIGKMYRRKDHLWLFCLPR